MNTRLLSPASQEITRSRRIGLLIYPDCDICDVCGPLDVFHFADYWLPRFWRTSEPGYQRDFGRLSGPGGFRRVDIVRGIF